MTLHLTLPEPDLTQIDWWEIPQRLATLLKRENCKTVHDVLRLGRRYFSGTPGLGKVTLHELDAALHKAGYSWLVSLPSGALEPRTVRVRILVAVDDKGDWGALGHHGQSDEETRTRITFTDKSRGIRYHWIEADVPLPEAETTIAGTVSEDKA